MKAPLISVILTSYNDAKNLKQSLGALKAQTLKDIEIVCIDDASTDESAEIINEFCKNDGRFRLIVNEKNTGPSPSAARNKAIERAKAPYIMFCDADDYYEPSCCEKMYQAITETGADLGACEINVIYHAHQEMKVSDDNYYALKFNGLQCVNEEIITKTDVAPTNKIFRKSILDKYKIQFPDGLHYEDAYFCPAYLFVAKKVVYVNEKLYNYIRRNGSIMSQTWVKDPNNDFAIEHFYIAVKLFNFLEQHEMVAKYSNVYWQLFELYLAFAINNSKSRKRIRQVQREAKEFVAQHQEYLADVDISVKEQIQRLYSSRFHVDTLRIKLLVLKFMPTYRLEIENIQRMRTLRKKSQQILGEVDKNL